MVNLAVYNRKGEEVESLKVDERAFGSFVRYPLLKQAIVMYQANKRLGTATTKSRGMVAGSTRKFFRQKGTGNARVGNIRTGKRVGGGVTFAKVVKDFRHHMPKKQKKLARNSAVLAKLLSDNLIVVDELGFEKPRTKDFIEVLSKLKIERSCLVTVNALDENLYKSARNVPQILVMPISQLNAGDICGHQKMLFTKEAFLAILNESSKRDN